MNLEEVPPKVRRRQFGVRLEDPICEVLAEPRWGSCFQSTRTQGSRCAATLGFMTQRLRRRSRRRSGSYPFPRHRLRPFAPSVTTGPRSALCGDCFRVAKTLLIGAAAFNKSLMKSRPGPGESWQPLGTPWAGFVKTFPERSHRSSRPTNEHRCFPGGGLHGSCGCSTLMVVPFCSSDRPPSHGLPRTQCKSSSASSMTSPAPSKGS